MIRSKENQINAKLSNYLMIIIFMVLAIAIVALLIAGSLAMTGESLAFAGLLALVGMFAIVLSFVILYQNRKRLVSTKNMSPKVMTTVECKKCGTKNVREHQRGDFVFKEVGPCQKCSDQQLITAIFKEVTEKEKTYSI